VGNGNIDVGSKTPTRKTGRPDVERWLGSNAQPEVRIGERIPPQAKLPMVSGAMAEQRGDCGRGDQSAPQKLVRLVGCRDDTAGRPRIRPGKKSG
jgi:hypothetical protein